MTFARVRACNLASTRASEQPADRLRRATTALVLACIILLGVLAGPADISFAAGGSAPFAQFIAAGMLTSVVAETRPRMQRLGDGLGAVGLVTLCGIANGFVSLLGLHLHFATVDQLLFQMDSALGLDGPALAALVSNLPIVIHRVIGTAYTYTVQLILISLIVQAFQGERVEVWRAAFCFAGSLLTVCLVSIVAPAKGLGLWLSASTLERLPPGATRYFWPAFDLHYQGVAKLIRIDSIGAVVSFPSFHIIMGLILLALWRTKRAAFPLALAWFAAMLPATVAIGGHYFVDLIAGTMVWTIWFALSLRIAPATEHQTQQEINHYSATSPKEQKGGRRVYQAKVERKGARGAFVPAKSRQPLELTIVIPCLNEAETLAEVVDRANRFLHAYKVRGEVIVADNGSTDGSVAIAIAGGAHVVPIAERGYGAALGGGIAAARGTYVAMGDADCSYDFMDLMPFLDRLRSGVDLVVGNRFLGGIGRGAMPALHRYLGNPLLTLAGRLFYSAPIGDFHCGLRAFRRDSITALDLTSSGMEYASEMIVKAQLARLSIAEVPAALAKDQRSRPPHLRSWRDGWRHLKFLLVFAPRWLFIYPGIALCALGLAAFAALLPGDLTVGHVRFGVHTLLFASSAILIAMQLLSFGIIANLFGARQRYWPVSPRMASIRRRFSIDNGCIAGGGMLAVGVAGMLAALALWAGADFGDMNPDALMRISIPSVVLAAVGVQTILTSFLIELLSQPARISQE